MGHVVSLIYILGAVLPMLDVRWSSEARQSVTIIAEDRIGQVQACLSQSHQARVRFEVQLCRRRSGWFDYCEEPRAELHTARFDPVTESYRVVSDRLGDLSEPIAIGIPVRSESVRSLISIQKFPISFLVREEQQLTSNPNAYLRIRTVFKCREAGVRAFAHLSRFLTLGLINTVEDVSTWKDFMLAERAEGS
jgi:hypothetical protein